MRDLPVRVAPDFRPCAANVCQRIVRIAKLIEHFAQSLCLHLQRQIARIFHAVTLGGFGQNQLRAVYRHRAASLDAQIVRHDQNHFVAAQCRHHGQRDAGIATGCLDQRVAGGNFAASFRFDNHGQRRTVLDRSRRIIAFEFGQYDVVAFGEQLGLHAL